MVSAFNSDDITRLRDHIFKYFKEQFSRITIKVANDQQHLLSYIYRHCVVLKVTYDENGESIVEVRAPQSGLARLKKHIIKES